jgi:hypothetical protein
MIARTGCLYTCWNDEIVALETCHVPVIVLDLVLTLFYIPLRFGSFRYWIRELVRRVCCTTMSDVKRNTQNDHQPQLHSGSSMAWRFFEHCGYRTERIWSFFFRDIDSSAPIELRPFA